MSKGGVRRERVRVRRAGPRQHPKANGSAHFDPQHELAVTSLSDASYISVGEASRERSHLSEIRSTPDIPEGLSFSGRPPFSGHAGYPPVAACSPSGGFNSCTMNQ